MKMFKKGMNLIASLAVCSCFDLCGMNLSTSISPYSDINSVRRNSQLIDIKQSLDSWPKVNPLVTEAEKYYYDLIWDEGRSLMDNKKQLMHDFIENCFDFSFKLQETEVNGIQVGKVSSGEEIVFAKGKVRINTTPNSEKVLIYGGKEIENGLVTSVVTNVFRNVIPVSVEDWMKEEFEKYIMMIEEDSVGCEILRLIVAKYKGNQNLIPKLTIIPVDNDDINLAYTSGSNLWKYVQDENGIPFFNNHKYAKRWKFLLFSPYWFNTDQTGLLLKKDSKGNYNIDLGVVPRDVCLLHQIIYAMQVSESDEYRETQMISERSMGEFFYGTVGQAGLCRMSVKQINSSIFVDDRIYRTMFGFTPIGIDLISEARYVAHKYGYLRLSYLSGRAKMHINGKAVSKKDTLRFLKNFLSEKGDKDLYRYYLSTGSSLSFPEFGRGSYKYLEERR